MDYTSLLRSVSHFPHSNINCGSLHIHLSPDDVFDCSISPGCYLDLTGSITFGRFCMFGSSTYILTHDHYHSGRVPLLILQSEKGVFWKDKIIGNDVWLHSCTILCQVTFIPDGVVVRAGAVLTKNPGPYEIWAGNPARKIGER